MSHTEYSAQFVQYSSVFLGLEEALAAEKSFHKFVTVKGAHIFDAFPCANEADRQL
jgi:hypothetical protein